MNIPLATVVLTVTGLMVGVEFCVAVFINPMFDRLPGNDGLLGRADGARVLGRVMPFWYGSSIVLTAVLAGFRWGGSGVVSLGIAGGLLVVSILMSVLLLVPINNRAKGWTATEAPADWREQLQRWDWLHYIRLAVITAALVFLAVGALQGS